jgi:hypothetical protein
MTPSDLRDKLRKIEALFAGAGTAGERLAAEAALARVRARLAEMEGSDRPSELQVSIADPWSRQLFIALARRYGLKPYRLARQRRTTIMLSVPRRFFDDVLWPQFADLDAELKAYLGEVTREIIREEIWADASEAAEVAEAVTAA